MKYGRMSAKHIMFQVGSNELENKETDDIMEKLEKLVEVAREKVPHMIFYLVKYYQDFIKIGACRQYLKKKDSFLIT